MKLIKLIFAILFLIITTPIILLLSLIMWFYERIKRFFVKPKQPLEVKVFKDENGALSAKSLQEMKRLGFSKFEINVAKNLIQTHPEQEFTFSSGGSSEELEAIFSALKEARPEREQLKDEQKLKELTLQQQYLKGEISEEIAVWLFNQGRIEETIEMFQVLAESFPARKPYYETQIQVLTSP